MFCTSKRIPSHGARKPQSNIRHDVFPQPPSSPHQQVVLSSCETGKQQQLYGNDVESSRGANNNTMNRPSSSSYSSLCQPSSYALRDQIKATFKAPTTSTSTSKPSTCTHRTNTNEKEEEEDQIDQPQTMHVDRVLSNSDTPLFSLIGEIILPNLRLWLERLLEEAVRRKSSSSGATSTAALPKEEEGDAANLVSYSLDAIQAYGDMFCCRDIGHVRRRQREYYGAQYKKARNAIQYEGGSKDTISDKYEQDDTQQASPIFDERGGGGQLRKECFLLGFAELLCDAMEGKAAAAVSSTTAPSQGNQSTTALTSKERPADFNRVQRNCNTYNATENNSLRLSAKSAFRHVLNQLHSGNSSSSPSPPAPPAIWLYHVFPTPQSEADLELIGKVCIWDIVLTGIRQHPTLVGTLQPTPKALAAWQDTNKWSASSPLTPSSPPSSSSTNNSTTAESVVIPMVHPQATLSTLMRGASRTQVEFRLGDALLVVA